MMLIEPAKALMAASKLELFSTLLLSAIGTMIIFRLVNWWDRRSRKKD